MSDGRGDAARTERAARWRRVLLASLVGVLVAAGAALALSVAVGQGAPEEPGTAARDPASEVRTGRALFARMGCGNCHAFEAGNSAGAVAPDLDAALTGYTRDSLKAKIVAPYGATSAQNFTIMPTDFGRRMSDAELDALVTFLLDGR
jgi:mono/diheme cytochrome c family protein